MLSGDETGWLLGDYILSQLEPGPVSEAALVASTVVSSADAGVHRGRRTVPGTPKPSPGFKWLARAQSPGNTLVYAYEEAIGHCVDPASVRDKDGISAAILACRPGGRTAPSGSHRCSTPSMIPGQGARRARRRVRSAATSMTPRRRWRRLRSVPPTELAGIAVSVEDLLVLDAGSSAPTR